MFLLKLVFVKNLILPTEKKKIFEKKKTIKTTINYKKVAKLLTYGGQVIDPTAYISHIYIYIYIYIDTETTKKPPGIAPAA